MEPLDRLLNEHPFLRGLEEKHLRFLGGCARSVRFEEGQLLFQEGEDSNALFLVCSGRVALEVEVPGRGAVRLEAIEEGDVLGWSWLHPPYRSPVDARAVEPVRALAFDRRRLADAMEADHDFGYALLRRLLVVAQKRLDRARLQALDVYKAGL
jgi:CRP-like cAMP-binding protein